MTTKGRHKKERPVSREAHLLQRRLERELASKRHQLRSQYTYVSR